MNPLIVDPDLKVNMSLDEIIGLTRDQIKSQIPKRNRRRRRRRRKNHSKNNKEHSVALLSSTNGVDIYISKKSPLLNAEHRRRVIQAVSNRTINSDLIQKSKEIIPAEYKLVKTYNGVERVLVPAPEYFSKQTKPAEIYYSQQNAGVSNSFPDKPPPPPPPPPLMSVPIYLPSKEGDFNTEMEVDNEDDDIVELNLPSPDKKLEVIDLECDLPVDVVEAKKMCLPASNFAPQQVKKSLSERFTMITGSFQF